MARKKRIWYPGATYHVMSRGNRRTAIFKDVSDHLRFLECVQIIKEKHPFRIHSLCLMTNHFHIAVETQEIELWKIMQKILSIYAEEFNHKYNFTGHVFENRYTAWRCVSSSRTNACRNRRVTGMVIPLPSP